MNQDPKDGMVYIQAKLPSNGELRYHTRACKKVSWAGLPPGTLVEVPRYALRPDYQICNFSGGRGGCKGHA